MNRKTLSEKYPFLYNIAVKKEKLRRFAKDMKRKTPFATTISEQKLPYIIYSYHSNLIKTGKGIDPVLQENKAYNIDKASKRINGVLIKPGEEFSFWKLVGESNKKNGYKDGRVIINGVVQAGMGGGLCNLANTINLIVLHSPLDITEFHTHSDALAPDPKGKRVPLGNGTSVAYNYVDYRFMNNTSQNMQLFVWCADQQLHAELRSEHPIDTVYDIEEEKHRFVKSGDDYYRKSKIYKVTKDRKTGRLLEKDLIWDNHSKVMFDHELIPVDLIKES